MTGPISPEFTRAVRELEARVPQLARAVVAEYVGPDTDPARMPEVLRTTAPHTIRHLMRTFLREAREGRPVSEDELRLLTERARERAAEGVRLDQVVAVHHALSVVLLQAFQERFAGSAQELGRFMSLLQTATSRGVSLSVRAFQEELRAILVEQSSPLDELVQDLLAGRPPADRAAELSITLPESFTVLALHIDQDPEEAAAGPALRPAATARKLRRLRGIAPMASSGQLFLHLTPDRPLILLPGPPAADQLLALHRVLARAARAPVALGVAAADGHQALPEAAATAEEVLRVARAFSLPGEIHTMDQAALPYQLSRPTPAAAALGRRLSPALHDPELAATLSAYLDHDFDRRRTAQALGIHPNTVDNRLRRAGRLTGTDLGTADGLLTLAVVLARRRRDADGSTDPSRT